MNQGYYVVFKNQIFNILLVSDNNQISDEIFTRIKITQDDYNTYMQALKDKKEIYIDADGNPQTRYKLKDK